VLALLSTVAVAQGQAANGAALYGRHCKSCHGVRGTPSKAMRGVFRSLPDFADAKFFERRSQDSLAAVILIGKAPNMPAFKSKLNGAEAAAVAQLLRTFATAPKD
jgi:mono/diheme cytochrome c family protein